MSGKKPYDDPAFHFEIWRGPTDGFGDEPKAIYYVENHNGHCGYSELATDFEMATALLIRTYRNNGTANWMGPVAHMARQTLELLLKDLFSAIRARDVSIPAHPIKGHDLKELLDKSLLWLDKNGYQASSDTRLVKASHLIDAYHAIDPTGDLFRFGISYQRAYGKHKSYDRVGLNLEIFEDEFNTAVDFITHFGGIIWHLVWDDEELQRQEAENAMTKKPSL